MGEIRSSSHRLCGYAMRHCLVVALVTLFGVTIKSLSMRWAARDPWDANDSKMCLFEDAVPESKLSAVEAVKGAECSAKGRWEREPWVKEFKIVRVRM